jgi:serine/threonine protein kinase
MPANLVAGRYRLTRKILAGDPRRGVPTLWQAEDAGDIYFIKAWRRRGDDRADIKALCNREIRGLTRLQGHPGASELFVRLHDLLNDDRNYYAVLNGGRRILLADAFQARSSHTWLTNLSEVGRRRPLWEGLQRVAKALVMLHGSGTLHRSLTRNAVFVAPEGMGDFRLTLQLHF